jgi:putative zinc finger/helix-turn-helix YgiT family protein
MNCYKCGGEMRKKVAKVSGEYAGQSFAVSTEAMVCASCGYTTLHANQLDAYRASIADAYRKNQKLLTSKEIREIRSKLGMSQEDFAQHLGVVQDKSSDELIRIKGSLRRAEQNLADVLFGQSSEADEFSGGRPFSFVKLSEVISFFVTQAESGGKQIGPLHVNKLCWYADASNYKRHGVTITGSRYARLPLGPVLDNYRLIFGELQNRGIVQAKSVNHLVAGTPISPTTLSATERETLARVWAHFRNRLHLIVRDSHQERAWKKTGHAELISFVLVKRK